MVKNLPGNAGDAGRRCGFDLQVGNGNPFQTLPGKSHGERSLAGYSLWGRKGERDNLATEHADREKCNS